MNNKLIEVKIKYLIEENSDTIIINDDKIDVLNLDIKMFSSEIINIIRDEL